MGTKALRNVTIVSFIVAMAILLIGGHFAMKRVPPIPDKVVGPDGTVLTDRQAIMSGQDVYQRYGLMDHGSVWGHGTLRGMDFSATTLHMIGQWIRDYLASPESPSDDSYEALTVSQRGGIDAAAIRQIHDNNYEASTRTLKLSAAQAYALKRNREYWERVFGEGDPRYGFLPNTIRTAEQRRNIADFFFWTAWAAGTRRPGLDYSYTNNWPPDRSVGNSASSVAMIWSIGSILGLFVVLGTVIYIIHRWEFFYGEARAAEAARMLLERPVTASQRAAAKFFLVAGLLFIAQILNGGLLAHYTVHPSSFYVNFIAKIYPYSWAKTWHVQLAILWIAISWMGTAIYLAPIVAGGEPPYQRLLVNVLFCAAVAVVACGLIGEVLGIKGYLGNLWFWFGHQGWEYLELGRLWQILLFGGLIFWLVVVYLALAPALRRPAGGAEDEESACRRALVIFYVLSAIFVVAFFGFGLFYHRGTHLTVADYWRWFVVHIWVESIFEFFGVAVISLFLVSLGLVTATSALRVAYLTAILVFMSGIPGTAHHYFWYGGPSFWLALGGVFSSLEPIPLILLVVRAWMEYRSIREAGQEFPYRWPLYFITASSFWNFLGAGVFGFMINLPIINYYEHSTYLTSNHGHTALFGVYGMLAIALILFSWRGLVRDEDWSDRILSVSFWGLNVGLGLMFISTLLPVGILQTWHSYHDGLWAARSAEFYESPLVQTLGNWRIVPDTIIIVVGALPLLYFLISTFPKLREVKAGELGGGEQQG